MKNGKARRTSLVAGGAGFLGSHLCDQLLALGHDVIAVDNFHTGRRENIAHLEGHERFTCIAHDVVEPLAIRADWIFNLACPASPPRYQEDPVGTVKTNVLGALNLLDLARATGARILQASTSEVYGDPEVHPQPESYWGRVNPTGPRACYDEGKRVAETLFFDVHRREGVPVRVVRIFNTYGPRMDPEDGRVVSNFIVQALTGRPITLYGDGRQTRSFCFVSDLVEGLIAAMSAGEKAVGPINLGNPAELTCRELAHLILRLTGSSSPIVYHPLPQDDPRQRRPDISRAAAAIGWRPRTDIETGLRETIAYFRGATVIGGGAIASGGAAAAIP